MTEISLHHQDCLVGMAEMAAESVDVVVTSPPYNLGIGYGEYDDTQPREAYLAWCRDWAREIFRVLKPDGSFFLNIGASPKNPLLPHQIVLALTEHDDGPKWVLQNTIHWIKSITIETRDGAQISAGHFKPINSKRFINDCHENVFHLTKSGKVTVQRRAEGVGVPYQDKSNIARWGHTDGEDKRCRGNTWFIPYKTIVSRDKERPHPATFPVELAERCMRLHGNMKESTVLDPFLGIGHAGVAAVRAEAKEFLGFEIDGEYLSTAKSVIAEAQGDLFL